MKITLPIKRHSGLFVRLTQGYREGHHAHDFAIGTSIQTYGSELINPFPLKAYLVEKKTGLEAGLQAGNKLVIKTLPFQENGESVYYQATFMHCSDIVDKEVFEPLEVVAFVGNTGECIPKPTIGDPTAGSHLHFVLGRCREVAQGVWGCDTIEPQYNDWLGISGQDTGWAKDESAFVWAINKIKEWLKILSTK